MKVSIVIAAKSEAESIGFVLNRVQPHAQEIIVVCDSEDDPTLKTAGDLGARVLVNRSGRGRGRAIRWGVDHAQGDIIVFMDADGSHDGNEIPAFLEPILKNEADLVVGSRIKGGSEESFSTVKETIQYYGNRLVTAFVNMICGSHISDLHYGLRAIRTPLAKSLSLEDAGMTTEAEVFIKCWKRKARVVEIPAYELKRLHGESHLRLHKIVWECLYSYFKHGVMGK